MNWKFINKGNSKSYDSYWVVDTCALIDGRLKPLIDEKIIDNKLIIVSGVIAELKQFAASQNSEFAYQKGRATTALEFLKYFKNAVYIDDYNELEVDDQVVMVATRYRCGVVSLDVELKNKARSNKLAVVDPDRVFLASRPSYDAGQSIMVSIQSRDTKSKQLIGATNYGEICIIKSNQFNYSFGDEIQVIVESVQRRGKSRLIKAKIKY